MDYLTQSKKNDLERYSKKKNLHETNLIKHTNENLKSRNPHKKKTAEQSFFKIQ